MNGSMPAFPDDVPTAPIARVSLAALQVNDEVECGKLFDACTREGFFYLDLTTAPEGRDLLSESEELLSLAPTVFSIPLDERLKYITQPERLGSLAGYKPAATKETPGMKSPHTDVYPDMTEFWNFDKDHMYGFRPTRSYPEQITKHVPLMKSFMKGGHVLGMRILSILASHLGLEPAQFTALHEFESPSGDHIRLTRKPPIPQNAQSIGLNAHHDIGSVTVLFNWLGGLQIESVNPSKLGQWEYVKPLAGHAIINLGDATVKYSNGLLKSAKHRVIDAPGLQKTIDRYSVVYFVRPADDSKMEVIYDNGKSVEANEELCTAKDWMTKRLKSRKVPLFPAIPNETIG